MADLDGLDKEAIHVYGELKGTIIAVGRVLLPGVYSSNAASFGRIAVKKTYRKKGYGHQVMKDILTYIKDKYPLSPIECSAQRYLETFYKSFNFESKGKPYMEADIPHIKMVNKGDGMINAHWLGSSGLN